MKLVKAQKRHLRNITNSPIESGGLPAFTSQILCNLYLMASRLFRGIVTKLSVRQYFDDYTYAGMPYIIHSLQKTQD